MSLWTQLKGLISEKNKELVYARIPTNRVENAPPPTEAKADEHYFRVTLVQMFLQHKSKVMQDWYPAVHSLVACSFADQQVEIPNIADTSRLLAQQGATGDVIARNFTLVPLMPFKGGEVKLVAGLFAMQGQNLLQNVIGVMSDFAGLLAVPQISSALTLAGPLTKGIQTLFSGQNGAMHLGYHDSFLGAGSAGNILSQGHLALVRATEDHVDPNRLLVVGDQLHEGTGLGAGQHRPLEGHDFMLLRVEIRSDRDDWNQLTSISVPLNEAIAALGEADETKADALCRQALVAAIRAPELTKIDRRRVVELIKSDYQDARKDLGMAGLVGAEGFDLQRRMLGSGVMAAAKAAAMGEPMLEDASF